MLSDKKLNEISNVILKHFATIGRLNISVQNGLFIITGENAKELHDVLISMPYSIEDIRHTETPGQYSIMLHQDSAIQLDHVIRKKLGKSYLRDLCQDFHDKDPKLPIITIQDYRNAGSLREYCVLLPKARHRVLGEFQEYLNQRFGPYCDWTSKIRHEEDINGINYTGISITKYDIACMQKIDFDREVFSKKDMNSELHRLNAALQEAQSRNNAMEAMMRVLSENLKINMPNNTATFKHLDFDSVKRLKDGLSHFNPQEVMSCFARH